MYTGDIKKSNNVFDVGLFKFEVKQMYLSNFDDAEIYNRIKYKIENKIKLTNTEISETVLLPLMAENREGMMREVFNMVKTFDKSSNEDKNLGFRLLTLLYSIGKNFISDELKKEMKGWLNMSADIVREMMVESFEEGREEGMKSLLDAIRMLNSNLQIEEIVKHTGLSVERIKELKEEL